MGIKVKVGDMVVGEITDLRAAPDITGTVYEIKTITPSDVTQTRVTIPVSDGAYYDPFEPRATPMNPRPNRAQRRKQKKS